MQHRRKINTYKCIILNIKNILATFYISTRSTIWTTYMNDINFYLELQIKSIALIKLVDIWRKHSSSAFASCKWKSHIWRTYPSASYSVNFLGLHNSDHGIEHMTLLTSDGFRCLFVHCLWQKVPKYSTHFLLQFVC